MIQVWREWAAKLDACSLRERVLVFIAGAGLVLALGYAAGYGPLLKQQRSLLERLRQHESQQKSVEEALLKAAQPDQADPLAARRERLAQLEAQLAEAEKQLAARGNLRPKPEQMVVLLRNLLGKSRNVRVGILKLLPPTPLQSGAPETAKGARTAVPMYQHAVEIEVSGPYLDLLAYVADVEALPWRLGWSRLELNTVKHPEVALKGTLTATSTSPTLLQF